MRGPARSLPILLLLLFPLAACSLGGADDEEGECELGTLPFPDALMQRGAIRHVHDPVVARHDDQYVLFSTGHGVPIRRSDDLVRWTFEDKTVFDGDYPPWAPGEVDGVEFPWAPDISFFNDRYHLYYSLSTFGDQRSVIGMATNPTLDPADSDYEWTDRGKVVESQEGDDYNAIDPNVAFDDDGRPWLVWGSYWDGIKMRRLDAETGLPAEDDPDLHSLADRPDEDAIEAPFIVRHEGDYYLFVSFDSCCDGAASTYKIVVGRSEEGITGPYVDRDGTPMVEGGGTLVLAGYGRIRGPGHNAVFSEEGRHYLVHHFYDANDGDERGVPKLQVRSLLWGPDGWPLAGEPYDGTDPADFDGEPDLAGRWGHSVDFAPPEEVRFTEDGQVERCDGEGEWSLDESSLALRWPSGGAEEWTCQCIVAADGTWYVGRDQDGRLVRGWKVGSQ